MKIRNARRNELGSQHHKQLTPDGASGTFRHESPKCVKTRIFTQECVHKMNACKRISQRLRQLRIGAILNTMLIVMSLTEFFNFGMKTRE